MQLGAGSTFKLMPEVFAWKGFAGTFEGFGTDILPLGDLDDLSAELRKAVETPEDKQVAAA